MLKQPLPTDYYWRKIARLLTIPASMEINVPPDADLTPHDRALAKHVSLGMFIITLNKHVPASGADRDALDALADETNGIDCIDDSTPDIASVENLLNGLRERAEKFRHYVTGK